MGCYASDDAEVFKGFACVQVKGGLVRDFVPVQRDARQDDTTPLCSTRTGRRLVSDHRGARGVRLADPGESRLSVCEQTADRINEDRIGCAGLEAARLFERDEALHPPVAFEDGGPIGAFAPQHPNASENKSVPFNVQRILPEHGNFSGHHLTTRKKNASN